MAQANPKKKVPCEECRDQKRKCNGETPCERCFKFNLSCVYISSRSPKDEEYLELARQASLVSQIESLNNQIIEIENSINDLKKNNTVHSPSSPQGSVPSLTDDSDHSVFSGDEDINPDSYGVIPTNENRKDFSLIDARKKRRKLFSARTKSKKVDAYLSQAMTNFYKDGSRDPITPWTLTFKSGDISIETHIKNHSELLDNLYHMMGAVELELMVPPIFLDRVRPNIMMSIMNLVVRRNYGKAHCQNAAQSAFMFSSPPVPEVNTIVIARSPDSIQTTTLKLIRAYISCQHLQQMAIHSPTFFRLFMSNPRSIDESPAIMALCASICTMRCKHLADCLASISLVEYGAFYFEKARELLSDLFDQPNLETLTSYTFMTAYKLSVSQISESMVYLDMAERIIGLLAPYYQSILKNEDKNDPEYSIKRGEAIHFSRLQNHLHFIRTYQAINAAYNPSQHNSKHKMLPYSTVLSRSDAKWELADDDSPQERDFTKMHNYIIYLRRIYHDASHSHYSNHLQHLIGLIGHQVEMAIRYWYYNVLPPEFRLSLPLFDSSVDYDVFLNTLERESQESIIPVLTTMVANDEWIILGQSYLPKNKPEPGNEWSMLSEIWDGGPKPIVPTSEKWVKRIEKMTELRTAIDFDGTDQEYLNTIIDLLAPSDEEMQDNTVTRGIHAAFNNIRIIQFLRSRKGDCYFEMRYLLGAWQIFIRTCRIKALLRSKLKALIPRIHKYLNICMEIIKEEVQLQPYQGMVSQYAAKMEAELNSEIFEDYSDCLNDPNMDL